MQTILLALVPVLMTAALIMPLTPVEAQVSAPQGAPPAMAAPDMPPAGMPPATMPPGAQPPMVGRFVARFQRANVTHDGRLTLAQAQAANMRWVVRNFGAIDAHGQGYVTLDDIHAYRQAHMHQPPTGMPGQGWSAPAGAPGQG